ncbi:ABC transporter ATP-binding protein [Clostridia bacterium]|nr:ABC transporter ATP-binding protein [Clostridia bacterium]
MECLKVQDLNVYYGVIQALKSVSFLVEAGTIVTLIGANGAGKTSLLHTISALISAKSGKILLNGKEIQKLSVDEIVRLGMAHVPEGRRVFAELSVRENLELGAYIQKDKKAVQKKLEEIFERFPRLKERINQQAGTLSGGEQQLLAIGRALMSSPSILLLDEPSMGLAPIFVEEIFSLIQQINQDDKTTILLVEQNAHKALSIAHQAYVLENGEIVLSGKAKDLLEDPEVKKAYLGA